MDNTFPRLNEEEAKRFLELLDAVDKDLNDVLTEKVDISEFVDSDEVASLKIDAIKNKEIRFTEAVYIGEKYE